MIVLSWDVGITHLAYCILKDEYDVDKDKHDVTILDWDNIDLLLDERIIIPCCGMMKTKKKGEDAKKCTKKATYCQNLLSGEQIGFCKMHLPQHESYWTNADTLKMFGQLDKNDAHTCDYEKKTGDLCMKKANTVLHSISDTYYCSAHAKAMIKKMTTKLSPNLIKKAKTKDFSTGFFQLKLVNELDSLMERFCKLGVKGVIIENQPVKINAQMKSIANTLYDYFLIRGLKDKVITLDFLNFFAASNKLKINEDNTLEVFKANKNEKDKYKLTKKLGIEYTKKLLQDDDVSLFILSLYTKKDDLCDSYLQGRYYLEQRHDFGQKKTKKKAAIGGSKTTKKKKVAIGGSKTANKRKKALEL
uniref:Mitochondrial resolvase Ydc2 catalytic domain-containing protein n=1 Tax=viral metagenome TaxID=1070528 RepID=A0A6C0C9E8_9ZZZZ